MAAKALGYARAHPHPDWLDVVDDDGRFVDDLIAQVDAWTPPDTEPAATVGETFGASDVFNRIKLGLTKLGEAVDGAVTQAVQTVGDVAKHLGNGAAGAVLNPVVKSARPYAHRRACLYIGDVFEYLTHRRNAKGEEGSIVKEVAGELEKGNLARTDGDRELIVVAHSMGGNIVYDILTQFRPKLVCDVFVTVGSQVGLFAELGLFLAVPVDRKLAPDPLRPKVPLPPNIKRWINVYDHADVLSYAGSGIFEGCEDYVLPSGAAAWTAHSMYFQRPLFYERLRARLAQT